MNTRILHTHPLLALRGDLACDAATITRHSLATLMQMPATHASDTIQLLNEVPDEILHLRLTTCLAITQPALVIVSPTTQQITHSQCMDGIVYLLPTRTPAFAHLARTRPLPPHEYARRAQLLTHPDLDACIALAHEHGTISRSQVAAALHITTASATTLLKSLTPVFYPTDATSKHFVYDIVAHRAVTLYPNEATHNHATDAPRQQLPEVVRRYCNHLGKINQLPVRRNDREVVLHYLAQQLPAEPLSESQINTAILTHVAFDDYATARRDLVDFGFVTRTANGSIYQRIDNTSN